MKKVYEFKIVFCYEFEGIDPIRSEFSFSLYEDYLNCLNIVRDYISSSKIKTREVLGDALGYNELNEWVVSSNDNENKMWLNGAYYARIIIEERKVN